MTNIPIKILKDKNQNQFVPFTVTDAVFIPNSNKTVKDALNEVSTEIQECPDEALTNNDIDNLLNGFAE